MRPWRDYGRTFPLRSGGPYGQACHAPHPAANGETFEEDFKKDGYTVQKVDEGEYKGFVAHRHYNQLSDIKESKLLRTYDFETWSHAAQYAVKNNGAAGSGSEDKALRPALPAERHAPVVTYHGGLLFDTVSVHKTVQLSPREAMKDPRTAGILRSIMGQFDLRFILKLPTRVDSANATSVSEDGRVLMWRLPLGEDSDLDASVTYLNPMKAAGWIVLIGILGGLGSVYFRKRRREKALEALEKKQSDKTKLS